MKFFDRIRSSKAGYYMAGLIQGDLPERMGLYRYTKQIVLCIGVILFVIGLGIIFQNMMIRQSEAKKTMDETSIIFKETFYNKEKTESLNAIMTKLDEVGSKLDFPEKPAVDLTEKSK